MALLQLDIMILLTGLKKQLKFIFFFNGEIYGEKLTVLWLDKIRDMIKFDGIDQLIKQMKEDEQIARDFKA